MPDRILALHEARVRAQRLAAKAADEIREARRGRGLRQSDLASALGWSASKVGRMERGQSPPPTLPDLVRLAACVGLHVSLQLHPAGSLLRDGRQVRLINELASRVRSGRWTLRTEVPVGDARDYRAIDIVMRRGSLTIAVEVVSRLRDAQAQSRPLMLKARAIGADRLVLVVAGTAANRRAVAEAGMALRASFPLGTYATLAALRAGRDPGANALIFL